VRKLPPRLAGRELFCSPWLVCYRPLASSIKQRPFFAKARCYLHRCLLIATPAAITAAIGS
jgi:hypothetical protein